MFSCFTKILTYITNVVIPIFRYVGVLFFQQIKPTEAPINAEIITNQYPIKRAKNTVTAVIKPSSIAPANANVNLFLIE